jgi:hypothetical protein
MKEISGKKGCEKMKLRKNGMKKIGGKKGRAENVNKNVNIIVVVFVVVVVDEF